MTRYIVRTYVAFENVSFVEAESKQEAEELALIDGAFLQKHLTTHLVQMDEMIPSMSIAEVIESYKEKGYC